MSSKNLGLNPLSFPREPFWPILSCDILAGCAWVLTQIAKDNGQEDQAVQQTQQGDQEVEAEEENLNKLGLSKAQDEDPWEVGHGHASEHLEGS